MRPIRPTAFAIASWLALAAPLQAQTILYWSPRGPGAGLGGNGLWDLNAANWAPTDAGIVRSGTVTNAQRWPALPGAAATDAWFDGTAGVVTIGADIALGTAHVRTDGYSFSARSLAFGSASAIGGFDLAAGTTTTLATDLRSSFVGALALPELQLGGTGTVLLKQAPTSALSLRLAGAQLRPGIGSLLANVAVTVTDVRSQLQLTGFADASVGSFTALAGHVQALGDTVLNLTGLPTLDTPLVTRGGFSGSDASALRVGSQRAMDLTITGAAASSTLGSLTVNAGQATLDDHVHFTLNARGSTGFGGTSSLFVEGNAALVIGHGSQVDAYSTPQVHNNGILQVLDGSQLNVLRGGSGYAEMRIGYAGSTSVVTVDGTGSLLASQDVIRLGRAAFTPSPGIGRLEVSGGATVQAPLLSFGHASSVLAIGAGSTARFGAFDQGSFDTPQPGTVAFDGGTLVIGAALYDSLRPAAADQSFAGLLTGHSGTLVKQDSGTLTLSNDASTFAGQVQLQAGALSVSTAALRNALVTTSAGTRLLLPSAGATLGAIAGAADLDQSFADGAVLTLGGGDHDAIWSGRALDGKLSLAKRSGSGTQTIVGGSAAQPFTAPSLSVGGGTFRLSGGTFSFTRQDNSITSNTSLFVTDANGLLAIEGGALVTAGSGVRVHNAGTLRVAGNGTALWLKPPAPNATAAAYIGSFGGGRLQVQDGGLLAGATHLLLGNSAEADVTSSLEITGGSELRLGVLQFEGNRSSFTVDRSRAYVSVLFERVPAQHSGAILLSDAADGLPALTIGQAAPDATPVAGTTLHSYAGLITDGPSGPGSLRKTGNELLVLDRPLGLTGRLIIDGGIVVPAASADALAKVQVVHNVAGGLNFSHLIAASSMRIGGLAGAADLMLPFGTNPLELGLERSDVSRFSGLLDVGSARTLVKAGSGTQVLSGSVRAGAIQVTGGELSLPGPSTTVADGVSVSAARAGDHSTLRLGASRVLDLPGALQVRADAGIAELLLGGNNALRADSMLVSGTGASARIDSGPDLGTLRLNGALRVEQGAQFDAGRMTLVAAALSVSADSALRITNPTPNPGDPIGVNSALNLQGSAAANGASALAGLAGVRDGVGGPGGITFSGAAGFHFLATAGGLYTGPTVVDGPGTLTLMLRGAPMGSRTLIARNGATIDFYAADGPTGSDLFDATGKTLRTDAYSRFDFGRATLVGGALRGTGFQVSGGAGTLDGTTLAANALLTASAPLTLRNATLFGKTVASDLVNIDGAMLGAGGTLLLRGPQATLGDVAVQGGVLALENGVQAVIVNGMAAAGGARITLTPGSRLAGEALDLAGALLVNNGVLDAPLVINALGRAKGGGRFGAVTVNDGGIFAPGNSPALVHTATATLGEGGHFEIELADATGAPGTGWDQWWIDGLASFEAGTTPNSRFTLQLVTLDTGGSAGAPQHFDPARNYRWTVLHAGSAAGFSTDELALDTSGFAAPHPGRFALDWRSAAGGGYDLAISYAAAVPEPSTLLMGLAGGALLAAALRRRRTPA